MLSFCGNRAAFDQLVSISANNNVVCLGYLMLLLYSSEIPDVILRDKDRAILVSREILLKVNEKIRNDSNILSFVRGQRTRDNHKYGQLSRHEQFILGALWRNGIGVEKNDSKAARLFALATDQSHHFAQYNLALCFKRGEGVAKDLSRAVSLFTSAADQGHADAQYNLASCSYQGEGVTKDLSRAVSLYTSAADQGHADAQHNLAFVRAAQVP
jgi:TPR repeat protein